jgi:adenosylhomocysteine nucleosidase
MIALLCATPREMACLLPLMEEASEAESPRGTRLKTGTACGCELLVMAGGMGKVPAAAASRFILDRHRPHALINFGAAGALEPHQQKGHLVIASRLISADTGVAHSGGFGPTGPGTCEGNGLLFEPHYEPPLKLRRLAESAAGEASIPFRLGGVVTCDQVVMDPQLREHLSNYFQAMAVDMEGAAAAFVAASEGIPFLAVKAISDEVSFDFAGMEKVLPVRGRSRRSLWGRRFLFSLTSPSSVGRWRQLGEGMRLALENMSAFLEAFLPKLAGG